MRFIYKIWSGYDDFVPAVIEDRLLPGRLLKLSWDRYIEQVERGDRVSIYFHGPGVPAKGVFADGTVRKIDYGRSRAYIRIGQHSSVHPLMIDETAKQIAELVGARGIQVFPVPQEWLPTPGCSATTRADTCRKRQCAWCPVLDGVPLARKYRRPERLKREVEQFVTGYWVIPNRHPYFKIHGIKPKIRWMTDLFNAFKAGQEALAYPLSIGVNKALRRTDLKDFDAIVPVPLSPDKEAHGDLHRTLAIARELSRSLKSPVKTLLKLSAPFSKRTLQSLGYSPSRIEARCRSLLTVEGNPAGRLLLVDDTATYGITLNACSGALLDAGECEVVGSTATLMLREPVLTDRGEVTSGLK